MTEPHSPATIVDGNAVAGMLAPLMRADPTLLGVTCGHCGANATLAETVVELCPESALVRCRSCTHTLLTLVPRESGLILRAGGVEISLPHP